MRSEKKRMNLPVTVCLLMVLLLLAGCGAGGSTETAGQSTGITAAETTAAEGAAAETTAAEGIAENTVSETDAAAGGSAVSEAFPVTITDMLAREVTITQKPERVVVLTAGECELVYALGGGDLVVGRGEYCDFPAEAADVPSVQSGYEINVEQILALQPDLIITSGMDTDAEVIAQLESAGVPVLESDETDIEGVYTSIENIGRALGLTEAAATCIQDMKNTFEQVQQKAAGHEAKTVYFEVSPLEWGLWTAGKGTFMDEIATLCGLENCFADVDGWAEISEEQVLERDPDIIVTISMYYGEGPTPVEEILGRAGWENVSAVAGQAILNLQNNELSRPSYRLAEGASMLADFAWAE